MLASLKIFCENLGAKIMRDARHFISILMVVLMSNRDEEIKFQLD